MSKEVIEYFRWQLGECWWYSKEDEEKFESIARKAAAYDEVSKAYQYYMPNDEQQHPIKLVHELNKILISNFSPKDFNMEEFTFRNYNDDLKESEQDEL